MHCSFQVDDLQKEVVVLKDRVQEQRAINESRASKQEENMNGLRTHLQQLVDDADQEDDRIKTVHTELTELLKSVEKLFLSVHCDLSPMYKILGKTRDRLVLQPHVWGEGGKKIYCVGKAHPPQFFLHLIQNFYVIFC